MSETIRSVYWNLSGSPTRADLDWPAENASDVLHLPRHSAVRLLLPGRREFAADDVQVYVQAPGERVRSVDVQTDPLPVDRAAAYAARVIREWSIPGPPLAAWRASVSGVSVPRTSRETAGPIAAGGPVVGVQLFGSLDPDRPVTVEVGFFWPDVPSVP
jgi:hypothetical protein